MAAILTPTHRRELVKAQDTCGRVRLMLDALQEAVGGMDDEFAKLEKVQTAATRLLELDTEGGK